MNSSLARIVRQNLYRNAKHFSLSALGIVIGIAAFVFFLGLSGGVRKVILGDIFPLRRVEVIAPKTTLTGIVPTLDDAVVDKIRARPEVERALPKMKMAFPARGWGNLLGTQVRVEVAGFCDGVDPALLKGDPGMEAFQNWEELHAQPGPQQFQPCGPEPTNVCPADHYCGWDRQCHHRVPVVVSRTLVELYNGSFAPSHGLPRLGAAQEALLTSRMKSLRFVIALGESHLSGSTRGLLSAPEQVEAQLVGISDKAMPIGMTVPIDYIRRWNKRYAGDKAATAYSSVVVDLRDKGDVAVFSSWVKKQGLEEAESQAARFALVITIVTLLFVMISFVIVGMSAVNIAHTFYMLISDRRREIGILRTVGATRRDIRAIFLLEAALLGLGGGVLGIALGVMAGKTIDLFSGRFVPDFPFKPTTYFLFTPTLLGGALVFAVGFCVLGAFWPARKAASLQPAQALTS